MSRFGRNYLQVGFYTEILFPQKDVRFIAVNNSVDSENQAENDFTPFLNIMNEWYARDTSNKIKSIFNARMADGKRCSGSIPYGYNRLPDDKQMLVVDPVASKVVRRIFQLANGGAGPAEIARILSGEKVLIPSAYTAKYHPEQNNARRCTDEYRWSNTTVTEILDRQEYLGHTVLKKTVCTNFKTGRRRAATEDELLFFPNTHEPIIDQDLWDSVQKKRVRCPRKTPNGTYKHRLSGYLFCADCGTRLALQSHKKKNGDGVYYNFRCSAYGQKVRTCSAHCVSAGAVEELLLTSLRRLSRFVIENEEEFARQLLEQKKSQADAKPDTLKAEYNEAKKRFDELDRLARRLYEDFAAGIIPKRQYRSLSMQYNEEQDGLEAKMESLEDELAAEKKEPVRIERFIQLIRQYKNPETVTDEMLRELIDKIVVYEPTGGRGRNRTQRIDIYYNYIGQFELAFSKEELLAEQEKQRQLENGKKARQKQRNEAHRARAKAARYAANEGHKFPKAVCARCGREFWPTGNRQKYCSDECRKAEKIERIKAKRDAEKGGHRFRQKKCIICGKPFWPSNGQELMCSEECKAKRIMERQKAASERQSEKNKAKREHLLAENGGHRFPQRVCEYCGALFWPARGYQKYCCRQCGKKACAEREAQRKEEVNNS